MIRWMDLEVARARSGDEAAFARLIERFAPALYRFVRRFTPDPASAEDLLQETFIRAHRAIGGADPSRPFAPWLFRIAANLAITASRAARRRRRHETHCAAIGAVAARHGGASAPAEEAEIKEVVRRAIDDLPPCYRAVVVLYYLEACALGGIAQALGIAEGTVKVRLHRARALLRARLDSALSGAPFLASGKARADETPGPPPA